MCWSGCCSSHRSEEQQQLTSQSPSLQPGVSHVPHCSRQDLPHLKKDQMSLELKPDEGER